MDMAKKICIIFILIVLINILLLPKTFAFSNIIKDGQSFLKAGEDNAIDETALRDANNAIYNVLLGIGIVVAVVIGAVLGIQFIFESAEGKAKIAEALIPYIVGCFIVFGAFGIWKIVINARESIEGTVTEKYATDDEENNAKGAEEATEDLRTALINYTRNSGNKFYNKEKTPGALPGTGDVYYPYDENNWDLNSETRDIHIFVPKNDMDSIYNKLINEAKKEMDEEKFDEYKRKLDNLIASERNIGNIIYHINY